MKQSTLPDTPAQADAAMRSIHSTGTSAASIALLWLAATACGFPRPPDIVGDAPGGSDGSAGPSVAIHVSPSGDNANDGLTLPVKTLKHAIELAAANTMITQIILATGTYSASSGETFPYIIPSNVTVGGPGDGSAILVGDNTGPGVTIDTGGLQDLDVQGFATAITVTGAANLKNVRVLASTIAVQAEATASLNVNNLDITGIVTGARPCSTGIVLDGAAKLVATTLTTRSVGTTLDARDQSVVAVANATVSGDPTCSSSTLIVVVSTASFSLSDSLLDGGATGITIAGQSTSFHATISNTIVRNMKGDGLSGFPGLKASFQMTGGELSNNGEAGAELGQGIWTFTNVAIRQNHTLAFYLQDANLVMRNCTIVGNAFGIDVFQASTADLGTSLNPGNNILQSNSSASIFAESGISTPVSAIGNIWNPNVQGADENGKYALTATISGPVAPVPNGNYQINENSSLSR
ncbi:MAG TPA: DUF1565 domain-containing protein [Kofleriaceae bacterium]|jgi:hypothetical protein|nr:DUF1565 domain-containing protein [Kofleriaceae bacterium]